MEEERKYFESFITAVIKAAWDIFSTEASARKKKNMLTLSEDMKKIAGLLDKAKEKIRKKLIPKDEAVRLEVVISYAEKLATPFKKKYPKLAEVFQSLLPYIASEMQLADYVIKGKMTQVAMLSNDKKNIKLYFTPDDQINQVYKKLGNAVSAIEEHSRKFEQLSK